MAKQSHPSEFMLQLETKGKWRNDKTRNRKSNSGNKKKERNKQTNPNFKLEFNET